MSQWLKGWRDEEATGPLKNQECKGAQEEGMKGAMVHGRGNDQAKVWSRESANIKEKANQTAQEISRWR